MKNELLRLLPKTDLLLNRPALAQLSRQYPYALVKEAVQSCLEEARSALLSGEAATAPAAEAIEQAVIRRVTGGGLYSLKRVINATGVVLHTNLGRAPLGAEAAAHLAQVAGGYCNLEYDLRSGSRGSRYDHVETLLQELTGAEAALVVNNNAGAVFLMLNTLAKGRRVAISRGELVEIGGSFRVPEIMEQSGAELMEVGTTNKTHLRDYAAAIENGAELLLKVHTSNYRVVGFTQSADLADLSVLAREKGVLLTYDLGAGFLFPSEQLGLRDGETVGKCLRDGANLVCFSADKLLGSAQAGILVGDKVLIERIKHNHFTRMLRIDKLSLAALELTLRYSKDPALARRQVPVLGMLAKTEAECRSSAVELEQLIKASVPTARTEVLAVKDEVGGGSLPGVVLDGAAVAVSVEPLTAAELEASLRANALPIITRICKEKVLISVRTLRPGDQEEIAAALAMIGGSK